MTVINVLVREFLATAILLYLVSNTAVVPSAVAAAAAAARSRRGLDYMPSFEFGVYSGLHA